MFTRYDYMIGRELKKEATRRFGSNRGKDGALRINRNQSAYKYRELFKADDIANGIDPYLKENPRIECLDTSLI